MNTQDQPARTLDVPALRHLLDHVQSGVTSRRQIRELGGTDDDIARLLRRRNLTRRHPGVYVAHNGPLTWEQRAWAAVLAVWPAALSHRSALPAPLRPDGGPIRVAVDVHRTVRPPNGVVVHRTAGLDARVDWLRSPPRIRLPEASIDVVTAMTDQWERYRTLADICQTRLVTPQQIATALDGRPRVRDRDQVRAMLDDLATGACSVLERAYLDLERRHGLPSPQRQRRDVLAGHPVYRDVPYAAYRLVIELDGRAFHDTATGRDRDLERDLDSQVAGDLTTVRLSAGQVLGRGCSTIAKIGLLLIRRGWPGPFERCPACP